AAVVRGRAAHAEQRGGDARVHAFGHVVGAEVRGEDRGAQLVPAGVDQVVDDVGVPGGDVRGAEVVEDEEVGVEEPVGAGAVGAGIGEEPGVRGRGGLERDAPAGFAADDVFEGGVGVPGLAGADLAAQQQRVGRAVHHVVGPCLDFGELDLVAEVAGRDVAGDDVFGLFDAEFGEVHRVHRG